MNIEFSPVWLCNTLMESLRMLADFIGHAAAAILLTVVKSGLALSR